MLYNMHTVSAILPDYEGVRTEVEKDCLFPEEPEKLRTSSKNYLH